MNTVNKTSRILGVAFLLQYITSVINGFFLQPALTVPGNISESMIKIANNPSLVRAYVLVEVLSALGIIFLGAMLFQTLRKQNEKMALVALGFYILEAVLGVIGKSEAFSLLHISQEYVTAGQPAYLQTMANLALGSMDFVGTTLLMLAFCPGAIIFYYLLYKSRVVPRALSLWGLITVVPMLIAILLYLFDVQVSELILLPYFPFEGVIAIWILVKGIKGGSAGATTLPSLRAA
jgi:hypothetical protein